MTGVVYFAQSDKIDQVKVGYTTNLKQRFKQLRSQSCSDLSLIGCIEGDDALERRIQSHLIPANISGEWFHATHYVVRFCRALVAGEICPDTLDWKLIERTKDPRRVKAGFQAAKTRRENKLRRQALADVAANPSEAA